MSSEAGDIAASTLSRNAGEGGSRRSKPGEGAAARGPSPSLSRDAGEGQDIPTYYDQPALKASFYGWKVSGYMFVAGLAGSAQILAAVAAMADRDAYRGIVRRGRYIALAGAAAGAPLLILDLHTPQRFYNMLRIVRPTSPMSIGSWVLTGFGALSAVLAAAQIAEDRGWTGAATRPAVMAVQVPAAALGAAMSTYTGALLAATSTPLWAAAPRLLPALFGASAMASAAAALSLAAEGSAAQALSRIELVASSAEFSLLAALRSVIKAEGIDTGIGVLPLLAAAALPAMHEIAKQIERPESSPATARRAAFFGKAAAVGVIAGAFLLRHLILRAGNRSAERPREHFRFARPR